MQMLVLKTDGTAELRDNTGLESLKAAVGGYIEGALVVNGAMMYCNEEGKLLGLQTNELATLFYQYEAESDDFIAGDVAFVGIGDGDGEDYDVPEWVKTRFLEAQRVS